MTRRRLARIAAAILACGAATALAAACGSSSASETSGVSGARPIVALSVAPLADIARNVAGGEVTVVQLIPDGTDSHTYEPSPQNAKDLERADVVFLNGLHLEQPTLDLARANAKPGSEIVLMGERTIAPSRYRYDFSFPRSGGDPNPHLWMNPLYAGRYSEIIADTLARRFPAHAATFRRNQAAFAARIRALDAAITTSTATIPPRNRKLVTYHDSFAYFAPRYGLTVIGAVQPADFSEPTPGEVQGIIAQVKREGVPAIFGSEVFPSTVLAEVASESGARYVDKLRDDDLPGAPDAPNHTYLGLMQDDVVTMTRALGGNPAAVRAVRVSDVSQ